MNKLLGESGLDELIRIIKEKLATQAAGGIIYGELVSDNFELALKGALELVKTTGRNIIDMTWFSGDQTLSEMIVIDVPVEIRFGAIKLTSNTTEHMFKIDASNVTFIGAGRRPDKDASADGCTSFIVGSGAKYHFYSRGNRCLTIKNLDLIGVRSISQTLTESGAGGIYIENADPTQSVVKECSASNIIDNVYIQGSYCHSIYLGLNITSSFSNIRISESSNTGIYVNGGTSLSFNNIYISSAYRVGIEVKSASYVSLIGCVAEYSGIGIWVRSCTAVSLFSPGIESTQDIGRGISNYGLTTTDYNGNTVDIKDVPSESYKCGTSNVALNNLFVGTGILVTGGQNISIYSPYFIHLAQNKSAGDNRLAAIYVLGTADSVTIDSPFWKDSKSAAYHDFVIGNDASNCTLVFNDAETAVGATVIYNDTSYTDKSTIFCGSASTYIRSGRTIYPIS